MIGWQLWCWLIYWVILGRLQAYHYYERYMNSELRLERLEHSFSEARLNALRMQLDPHFLFNALNTISSHVERDPKLTRRMIEHLGDLLRMSLESKDRQEVPLAEELAFLEHYLEIQKIRFGDSAARGDGCCAGGEICSGAFDVHSAAGGECDPPWNFTKGGGGNVCGSRQAAGRPAGNSRAWMMAWVCRRAGSGASEGLGLSITRQRIAGLHPNGMSSFAIRNRTEGGTVVDVSLPLRRETRR